MDLNILKVKGFNIILIFLIAIQLILFIMTSLLFVFSSIQDESIIKVISAFSFVLISVPISFVLYKSNSDKQLKYLFLMLSMTLATLALAGIVGELLPFSLGYTFLPPFSMALTILSFVPIMVGLYNVYREQKSKLSYWIKLLIVYVDIIFILFLLYFVITNKTLYFNYYNISISSLFVIFDIIVLSLSMMLIMIYIPVKLRYFFSIVFCFYLLSFIGDVFLLLSYFYSFDIFNYSQFFYQVMLIFMSVALLLYTFSNIKLITIEEVNKKLADTTLVIDDLIAQSPEPMCMCDPQGLIIKANEAYFNIFDLNPDTSIQVLNIFSYNFNLHGDIENFDRVKNGKIVNIDSVELRNENIVKYLTIKLYPTYSTDNQVTYYIMNVNDITVKKNAEKALKNAYDDLETRVKERTAELSVLNVALKKEIHEHQIDEDKIKASLKEKEVLLKEIHHRVKNNMQIISSMLGLQSSFVQDPELNNILMDSQNRIRSMALVHEKLYSSENMANVDFTEYIESLAFNLYSSYCRDAGRINLKTHIERTVFNIDLAIPLGLIVNELISNALKHAFPDGRKGEILVTIENADIDTYRLIVKDNGIGLPEKNNATESKSLGLQLVNVLSEQIDGILTVSVDHGTCFSIVFPAKNNA